MRKSKKLTISSTKRRRGMTRCAWSSFLTTTGSITKLKNFKFWPDSSNSTVSFHSKATLSSTFYSLTVVRCNLSWLKFCEKNLTLTTWWRIRWFLSISPYICQWDSKFTTVGLITDSDWALGCWQANSKTICSHSMSSKTTMEKKWPSTSLGSSITLAGSYLQWL